MTSTTRAIPNLDDRNRATGTRVTAPELYGFAKDSLRLDDIFWGTQEPYYSGEVLPFIRMQSCRGQR